MTACVVLRYRNTFRTIMYFFAPDNLLSAVAVTLPYMLLPIALAVLWSLRHVRRFQRRLSDPKLLQELRTDLSQIPTELRPIANTLAMWAEQHERSTARERDFVANAAHELRTPLAAIRINAEGLQQLAMPEAAASQLQALMSGVRRMGRVVEQLMTMLRNDRHGSLQQAAAPQALEIILQTRLAELSALADRKQIQLQLLNSASCQVIGQREVLESVIDNLVSNAIKYAPTCSRVEVRLEVDVTRCRLTVRDHGPGIADELKDAVFERFRRGDGPTDVEGIGLGLSIVREGVQAMGGSVSLHNPAEGVGLLAEVSLPLAFKQP